MGKAYLPLLAAGVVLLFSLALPAPGLCATDKQPSDNQILEERLKHQNELNDLNIKQLKEKIEAANERTVDKIDALDARLNVKMDQIDDKNMELIGKSERYIYQLLLGLLAIVSLIVTLTGVYIWNNIDNKIKKEIQGKAKPAIDELIEKGKKRFEEEIARMRETREDYQNALADLKEKEEELTDTSKPVTMETKQELKTFVEKLEETKKEDEYTADDWFYKGIEEYGQGKYKDAAESFKRSYDKNNKPATLEIMAVSYQKDGNYEQAEKYYKKALEAYPKDAGVIGGYGFLLFEMERYPEALEMTESSLAIEAKDLFIFNKGHILFAMSEFDKAKEVYKEAMPMVEDEERFDAVAIEDLNMLKEKGVQSDKVDETIKWLKEEFGKIQKKQKEEKDKDNGKD